MSYAQNSEDFIHTFLMGEKLNNKDLTLQYRTKDFSKLWTTTSNHHIVGGMGKDHQRLRIHLSALEKSAVDARVYYVSGKSLLKGEKQNFKGQIKIEAIYPLLKMHYGPDNIYADSAIKKQGLLIATYQFKQDSVDQNSGVFEGQLLSKWYVDSLGHIRYDDIEIKSDAYTNNAFVGSWTAYGTEESIVCSWGDYRIPRAAAGFDIGAAEFSPAEKYLEFGWESYQKAWIYGDKKAKQKEVEKWWE